MKNYLVLLLLLFSASSFSQNINDYKYVVVPTKFAFLSETNQYNLNAITKSLFEKYGFVVYYDNEVPDDILEYNCNKLYADLESTGGMVTTKLLLTLKDCKKQIVFSSEGQSREKEYSLTYNLALRDAARGMENIDYHYNGTVLGIQTTTVKTINNGTTITQEVSSGKANVPIGNSLFAQPTANGFQLVDNTPKVVMHIFTTGSSDIFIAEKGNYKGVLYNKNATWILEYYLNDVLISEAYNIRF